MLTRRPNEPLLAYKNRVAQSNRDKMNNAGNSNSNRRSRRGRRNPPLPSGSRGGGAPRRRNPRGALSGDTPTAQVFAFTVNDLKANSKGTLQFGPNLTQYANFSNGVMKSYHNYRISQISVSYVTNASSTTAGAFAIEWDTGCSMTKLASKVTSFPVSKNFSRSFAGQTIAGTAMRSTNLDQVWLLYEGNGDSSIAGQLVFRMTVHFLTYK